MRADEESFIAKSDTLICELGRGYFKSHKEKHLFQVAVRHMRRLAHLLIEFKKEIPVNSLIEVLRPQYFDTIVKQVKKVAVFDQATNSYKSPSYALQIGSLLKRSCEVAESIYVKNEKDSAIVERVRRLQKLIENEWSFEISILAIKNLQSNQWNKPSLISSKWATLEHL